MLVFALALAGSAPALAQAPAAPTVAPCTVLRPTYTIDKKNVPAGAMFAARLGERQLLVTAHSVFGPAGGLPSQIGPDALAQKVTAATARDAFSPNTECARAARVLKIDNAAPMGNGNDGSKDVAAFELRVDQGLDSLKAVESVPLQVLPLAEKAAKLGDTVWLLAPIEGKEGKTWQAKVVEANDGFLFFEYTDKTIELTGTIGAPVVDGAGAVVGLNLGGGKMDDGALIGAASPLGALKQRLQAAK